MTTPELSYPSRWKYRIAIFRLGKESTERTDLGWVRLKPRFGHGECEGPVGYPSSHER